MTLLGNYDVNQIKKLSKVAEKIIQTNNTLQELSELELMNRTNEFQERIKSTESLDDILVEAFAVAMEVIYRVLGKKLYKVQLIGGIAMHQGRIVEMKTGEGKTLTEIAPAYLNALTGDGVHIITVNDYLAKRDKQEMESVFNKLGMTVGLVIDETEKFLRKEEYQKDITYSTNNQLGFDYLRDNLVFLASDKVQRDLNFVIIDEVDSILIDEARTPLILAKASEVDDKKILFIDSIVKSLKEDEYCVDLLEEVVTLNEKGVRRVEELLNMKIWSDIEYSENNHLINQSLRANHLLNRDKDYIICDNEIILIDRGTGRIADGRKMSDGLHQAIEAKEGVAVTANNKTLATITYQNFFRLYKKLSGMSGTVKTEEEEFKELYNLDVLAVPTNKPIARRDLKDKVYISEKNKLEAIVSDIIQTIRTGRPMLIVAPDVAKSEKLSKILGKILIEHKLLNAKTNNKEEADIIARAGEKSAITIATSIAGRGTDIKISQEVNDLGGLKVIGIERSMSRRIDNQVVGRAGRQGDNGSSQFYVSSQDEIFLKYVNDDIKKKLKILALKNKNKAIKLTSKLVNKSQKIIENINFDIRRETVKYDDIINLHRKLIYKERNEILNTCDIRINISRIILNKIISIVEDILNEADEFEMLAPKEINNLHKNIQNKIFEETAYSVNSFSNNLELEKDEIIVYYTEKLINYYNSLAVMYNGDLTDIVKREFLNIVDNKWINHLEEMEALRRVTNNQSFMQRDPCLMYKLASGDKFNNLIKDIQNAFANLIFLDILVQLKN